MFEILMIASFVLHLFGFFGLPARLIVIEDMREDVWRVYDLLWIVVCPVLVVLVLLLYILHLLLDFIYRCYKKTNLSDWLKSPLFKDK